jgi:hypothetical protein
MRITLEFDERGSRSKEPNMLTFHDAEKAVEYLKKAVTQDPSISVILTRDAADEFLGKHYEVINDLSLQLMRMKSTRSMTATPSDDGTLNFTNVQYGDIETVHDSLPCGAERREFVKQYEHWQLWWK